MLNLFWKFFNSPNKNWSKLITNKYGKNFKNRKQCCSHTYRNWQQFFPLFLSYTKSVVGNRKKKTNFWLDRCFQNPIRNLTQGPLPKNEDLRIVDSIIKNNQLGNQWNLENIHFHLPSHIVLEIKSHPSHKHTILLKIKKSWALTKTGLFSSKSAYVQIQSLYLT